MSKYESLFTQRVIEAIENRRRDRGMTIDDLCAASGIGRNSYYTKIRGDRCFNTEEIDAIANALHCDPFLILQEASQSTESLADQIAAHPERFDLAANIDPNKENESTTPRE